MIQERAMELVAALRSGKFKQGKGRLRQDGGSYGDHYCCLGVACELAGVKWEKSNGYYLALGLAESGFKGIHQNKQEGSLTKEAMDYFGFAHHGGRRRDGKPIVIDGQGRPALWMVNDDGVSFAKIADYIEENWEAL